MAAQAIGSLFVSLGLDSAAFTAGVKQAQAQASSFAARLGKTMAGAVATVGPAMAAAGAAAMNAAAEIKRAAQLANAAPEAFQGWAVGARSVGIEQDKLADILKDVNDRVGDFIATGGGPMADFFERIAPKVGVTAEQFRNLSGPQALQLYVDSLEKANVNQQDFTFFMEAMASDSTALLPLLKSGGKGMAEFAAKAASLGAIMDGQTVASFARAKQSFSEINLAFVGFRNIVAAQVVPAMAAIAQAFVNAAQQGHWLGDMVRALAAAIPRLTVYATTFVAVMGAQWAAAFVAARVATMTLSSALVVLRGAMIRIGIGAIVVAAGELMYQFTKLVERTGGVGKAFNALGAIAAAVWDYIVTSAGAIPDGLQSVWARVQADFMQRLQGMHVAWGQFVASLGADLQTRNFTKLPFGMGDKFREASEEMQVAGLDIQRSAYESQAAIDELSASAARSGKAAANAVSGAAQQLAIDVRIASLGLSELSTTNMPGLKQEADAATESLGGSGLSKAIDGAGSKAKEAAAKLTPLQEVMKRLREEFEKLSATAGMTDLASKIWGDQKEAGVSAASSAGKAISALNQQIDALNKTKEATKRGEDAFKDFFGGILEGVSGAKQALANLLSEIAKVQFSKGMMGLLGGTSWGGGLIKGIGSLLGSNANGTSNWRGGLTEINERGGEIVDLPSGTRIIPHDVSKRMVDGAGGSSQNVDVTVSVDQNGNLQAFVDQRAAKAAQTMGAAVTKSQNDRTNQLLGIRKRGGR